MLRRESVQLSINGFERLSGPQQALFVSIECEIANSVTFLPDKPEETAATTAAALWHVALGQPLSVQAAPGSPLGPLDEQMVVRLRGLLACRLAGEPLAHLTGRQHFMGLEFLATPEALIPRKETALLGEAAVGCLADLAMSQAGVVAVDTCTGSGNLALAMAHHVPEARIWGSDLSAEAVSLACRNAKHLGLDHRVTFRAGDLLAPLLEELGCGGKVDLLTCNPPYISSGKVEQMADEVRYHEPRLAFDGGPLGIRILQRLINEASSVLRPGGWLLFEVGLGQGRGMLQRLERHGGYSDVDQVVDDNGQVRVLAARRQASV